MGTAAKQTPPRVSVVMPINRADSYLDVAIASILNQSFQDFEFIIVLNMVSNELRDSLIQKYSGEERIRILESPPLGGVALALNLGIGEARGEYIARMDGDDISLPSRLEEQVSYLDQHPKVAVLGCRLRLIGPDSEPLSQRYPYYGSNDDIRHILPIRNPMPHPGLMMRKSTLFAMGGYKYGHSSEDYELFLRMSRNPEIEFHNMDSILLEYRRYEAQGTNVDYFNRRFIEMAGYLFTEFLHSRSPKYILGIVVIHPWARRMRSLFTRK